MRELLKDHFNELLLAVLSLIFAGFALLMMKHGDSGGDGFKWAAGIAGTIVGALLMKMQTKPGPSNPPGPLPAAQNGASPNLQQ